MHTTAPLYRGWSWQPNNILQATGRNTAKRFAIPQNDANRIFRQGNFEILHPSWRSWPQVLCTLGGLGQHMATHRIGSMSHFLRAEVCAPDGRCWGNFLSVAEAEQAVREAGMQTALMRPSLSSCAQATSSGQACLEASGLLRELVRLLLLLRGRSTVYCNCLRQLILSNQQSWRSRPLDFGEQQKGSWGRWAKYGEIPCTAFGGFANVNQLPHCSEVAQVFIHQQKRDLFYLY